MIAFAWDADGSDARSVPDGRRDAAGTEHDIPSQKDCAGCHRAVDRVLGATALQLDHDLGDLDLAALVAADRLSAPPASRFVVPGDATARAALGYLHANCGSCHNDLTNNPLRLWLRTDELASVEATSAHRTAVGAQSQADEPLPQSTAAVIVAPGDPEASLLHLRMTRRGDGGMPPLGTELVDEAGSQLVAAWIQSL
jgi:mono/diheme cytochrome c family protein